MNFSERLNHIMRLTEEYFSRHNISDVPIVNHCSNSTLIVKTKDNLWDSNWIILNIKYGHHPHRPGSYQLEFKAPIHDGFIKETIFKKFPLVYYKWHEYEESILDLGKIINGTAILGEKEIVLAAWEMFVFSYDSWFATQSDEIKRMLFDGLDKEQSVDERYENCQKIISFLSQNYFLVFRAWKYDVLNLVQNYADWLAIILNK